MSKRLTTADFIRRAREVHGNRYDYSLAEYVGNHKYVTIVCTEHGPFQQSPANHYAGKGCPDCGGSKPHTTESFIEAAREIHGDRYDYSQVEYTMNKAHVTIICAVHGPFSQISGVHLRGNGCPDCGGNKKHSTESFIKEALTVHGDRYDYSQVNYGDSHTKVTIICPDHGPFQQEPTSHLGGKGCPRCGWLATTEALRYTVEQFIAKAKDIHCSRYDYSMIEYVDSRTKVTIICSEHGPFEQAPSEHLLGSGCSECGTIARAKIRTKTTEQFIAEARIVHGDYYDYSLVEYLNGNEKVTIICPEHGPFEQKPNGHVSGKGCSDCAQTGFNPTEPGLLYYLAITTDDSDTRYKIGITNRSIKERFPTEDLARISIVKTWQFEVGHDARKREAEILNQFARDRYYGPDILVGAGNTELFNRDVLGLDNEDQRQSVLDEEANLISRPIQHDFGFRY